MVLLCLLQIFTNLKVLRFCNNISYPRANVYTSVYIHFKKLQWKQHILLIFLETAISEFYFQWSSCHVCEFKETGQRQWENEMD